MRIAVAGATGRIGRLTITALEGAGHQTVPLSRATGVDAYTGSGLADALRGVDALIDVTNNPSQDRAEIVDFFGTVTMNLLAAEGPVPWSIVRATQFHDFAAMVAGWTEKDGAATIAPLLVQPIAHEDVAAILADVAAGPPLGAKLDIAGPETQDLVDMARRTLAARGQDIRLIPTWRGPFGPDMGGEVMLPGEGAKLGATTFDDWLAAGAGDGR
jgi:uncharacterized protein YbjT (DUF2867 family)